MTDLVLADFTSPGPRDFVFPAIAGVNGFTKPIVLAALSVVVIVGFFLYAMRKPALVPGKLQFLAETGYGLVRNSIARDSIGPEFRKYVPYLVSIFFFILVNNIFGLFPLTVFPTMSRVAFPMALAIVTWVLFLSIGISRRGFVGYFKSMLFPPGVPKFLYILVTPIELVSTLFVRPLSLSVRLFANMLAGHLLLISFAVLSTALFTSTYIGAVVPGALLVALTGFEILVSVLQAYIFTILTAVYIGGAMHPEH